MPKVIQTKRLTTMLQSLKRLYHDDSGVVMLETVLVFPLQLLITMVIIQIAHMYVAANLLQYAAFQGTRTYSINLVKGEKKAAELGSKTAWIIASTMHNTGKGNKFIRVQGYKYIYPDYDTWGKTQMQMRFGIAAKSANAAESAAWGSLAYWLDLNVPVGGPFIYHCLPDAKTRTRSSEYGNIGQVLMQQNARLYKPWPR